MQANRTDGDGSTIVITREQRDALHQELRDYSLPGPFSDIENMLPRPGRGVHARDLWESVARAAKVLDAIGWDALSDQPTYTVTLDRDCVAWVRERIETTEATLTENSRTLAMVSAEGDPWAGQGRKGVAGSLAIDVADLRSIVDADLEMVHACRAILDQYDDSEEADNVRVAVA